MTKRFAVIFAVMALIAGACGDDSADTTTTVPDANNSSSSGGAEGTLADVKARGTLRCGVSTSAIGFAEALDDGTYKGFDADYCRAVAAAVLNDETAVEFVGTTAAERFTVLISGEIDVLFRNTTWTQSRDTEIGGDFGPTTFFDGQQVMGKASFGFTEDSTLADVDGAKLCTNAGTTTEKNITEGARVVGAEIELVTVEEFPQAMEQFRSGACDLATTDGSALFGERFAAISKGEIAEGDWVIFPKAPISKEPLGPMYRQNDSEWADIINWTVYATFIADEYGVNKSNVAATIADPDIAPELGRLFGVTDDQLQTKMGLSADAFAQVISQVGNYDDIYTANLGPLGFNRPNTPNDGWWNGGLLYAPPAR